MYLRRVPAMLLYLNWTRVHFAHPRAHGSLLTRTLRSTCGRFEQAVQSGIVRSSGLRPIVGLNITDGHFCRFPPKNVASQVYDTPSDVGQSFLGLFLTLVPLGPRYSPQLHVVSRRLARRTVRKGLYTIMRARCLHLCSQVFRRCVDISVTQAVYTESEQLS